MDRDFRIDTLRGLLLVIMTLNHVHATLVYKGWIETFTLEPLGFVSAAEGFIFVSGLMVGWLYAKFVRDPKVLFLKTFSRAKTVYLHHIIPLFSLHLVAALIPFFAISWRKYLSFEYLGKRTLLMEALLLYQPEIFDILPLYVIFLLVAPFLLLLLQRKVGWVVVLLVSGLFWVLGQQFDPLCALNQALFAGHRCGWFNIFLWQVPFVLGMLVGFYRNRFREIRFFQTSFFVVGVFVLVIGLFLWRYKVIEFTPTWLEASVNKESLGWLRIVNLLALTAFFGTLFRWLPIQARIPGLDFLGQHSLQVFTYHVLLIYLIIPFRDLIVPQLNPLTYPLFMLLVVLSLLIPAFIHLKWVKFRRK